MSETSTSSKHKLLVTSSPHIYASDSVHRIMWEVNLSLLPAFLMSLYIFGYRAALVTLASVLGAIFAEALIQGVFLKKPITIYDGSAVITGVLLAFCVPVAIPLWIAFIGGFVSILFGKQVFGGLGQNIFNPAHVGRAILLASWPVYMTTWVIPRVQIDWSGSLDGFTRATPLGFMKELLQNPDALAKLNSSGQTVLQHVFSELNLSWGNMIIGNMGGCLGETSKIALLIGGIFLLIRGHITWHIPVTMMGTVYLGSLLVTGDASLALFHLLSGGVFVGAIFMATDMVTSPTTKLGRLLFGFGCGAITLLIRFKGGYPEGVCYSILIMNSLVPLIEKFTVPQKFGTVKFSGAEAKT